MERAGDRALPTLLQDSRALLGLLDEAASDPMWVLTDPQVEDLLGVVAGLRHHLERLEIGAAAEGLSRDLHRRRGDSAVDWLARCERVHAPEQPISILARTVRLAGARGDRALAPVTASLEAGTLSASKADALVRFHADVAPVADADQVADVLTTLTAGAADSVTTRPDGTTERLRGLDDRELRQAVRRTAPLLRSADEEASREARLRAGRALLSTKTRAGMTEYRWILDPEGAAFVDAAVSALSAPQPAPDGSRDERSPARRRADALLSVVQRGMEASEELPSTSPVQVVVTMGLDQLLERLPGAGVSATGEVLSAATVRRMACDAEVVPMVLGTDGAVLDVGHRNRLFTAHQRRYLWQRDKGCTFPGCTCPPAWCRAHHVVWWSRHGPTSVSNGALLCDGHHAYVHEHDLTATVTATGVTWHV